jgi:mannose-6-phosphate isomerase-like protein (cupin superfamily)
MAVQTSNIDRELRDLGDRPGDGALRRRLAGHGLEVLPALADFLASDLPIAVLEGYEAVLKAVLRREMAGEVSGATARTLAGVQQRVGLLYKYKSYAVKASSPLGYSIFLQNPGEGFSFQRHLEHKTEVFHILDTHPGGFVFLCTHDEWTACYERERFAAWLAGERQDAAYERFRIPAQPGDIFILDDLGIVHTVVGCILEEFATVSTDMVDRLHDQNEGRPIPASFNRETTRQRLRGVRSPASSRLVQAGAGPAAATPATPAARLAQAAKAPRIPPVAIAGGAKTLLADCFVAAAQYEIEPHAETAAQADPHRAAALYVRAGSGRIILGTAEELARATPPSLPLGAQDLLTIPPGIHYAFVNEQGEPLHLVEHKIPPDVALV